MLLVEEPVLSGLFGSCVCTVHLGRLRVWSNGIHQRTCIEPLRLCLQLQRDRSDPPGIELLRGCAPRELLSACSVPCRERLAMRALRDILRALSFLARSHSLSRSLFLSLSLYLSPSLPPSLPPTLSLSLSTSLPPSLSEVYICVYMLCIHIYIYIEGETESQSI